MDDSIYRSLTSSDKYRIKEDPLDDYSNNYDLKTEATKIIERDDYRQDITKLLAKSHKQKAFQYLTRLYIYYSTYPFPINVKHITLNRCIKNMMNDSGVRYFIKQEYYPYKI